MKKAYEMRNDESRSPSKELALPLLKGFQQHQHGSVKLAPGKGITPLQLRLRVVLTTLNGRRDKW